MKKHKIKRILKRSLIFSLAFIFDQYQKLSIKNYYRAFYLPGYLGDRQSFYHLLSREEKIGEIVKEEKNGEVYLKLVSKAGSFFNEKISLKELAKKEWDGLWRLVIFDIKEVDRKIRDQLRNKLKKLGFAMWQKSVYISPHPLVEEVNEYLKTNHLFPKVICLEAKTVGVKNNQGFAWIVFDLKKLKEKYLLVKNSLKLVIDDFKKKKIKKKDFIEKIRDLFQEYQELVMEDPFLPKGLEQSDWPRDKIKKKFQEILDYFEELN
jgi:phenylacetic acid degradation operon negative regulatory protein